MEKQTQLAGCHLLVALRIQLELLGEMGSSCLASWPEASLWDQTQAGAPGRRSLVWD
jgi:hypothetical protein